MPYGTSLHNLHSTTDLAAACANDSLCMWAAQNLPVHNETQSRAARLNPPGHNQTQAWAVGLNPPSHNQTQAQAARPNPPGHNQTQAWAVGLDPAGRAAAVAVASPDLSLRNRIAIWGEPAPAADLIAQVLPLLGPSYRPLGDGALIAGLCARLPSLAMSEPFGWMCTPSAQPPSQAPPKAVDGSIDPHQRRSMDPSTPSEQGSAGPGEPRWLAAGEMAAVTALLDRSFPDSYAWPGRPGVRRWAGIDGPDGELAAVAADAWSAPTVGFIAGVAVREDQRGTGLGSQVCRFLAGHLIARHGRIALMVDGWNDPAIRLYQRLGLTLQEVRAAWADPG